MIIHISIIPYANYVINIMIITVDTITYCLGLFSGIYKLLWIYMHTYIYIYIYIIIIVNYSIFIYVIYLYLFEYIYSYVKCTVHMLDINLNAYMYKNISTQEKNVDYI